MSNANITDKLITARIALLLKAPFFGNMATRLKLVEASEWCKTAAVDGRNFYYNTEFINSLTPRNLEFLFAHEILHCAFDHLGRVGSRDRKIANIAQDYAVNQVLVDDRVGDMPANGCYDEKFRGMPWEAIYDELMKNAKKYSVKVTLDEHLNVESIEEDEDSKGNGGPILTKEELEAIKDEVKEAMLQAAAAAGAGRTPEGILRLIKDITEPKIDWKQLIQQEIQSVVRSDYSFARPNRKSWHSGAILPGMMPETMIDVAIAIDMSGSIGHEDAAVFLGEVKGIIEQYSNFVINLWCFDTAIYNHQVITHDNVYDLEEYQPQGGGGTLFEANWDFMKDNDIVPKKFIMFTDGAPGAGWGDEDYCSTIFVVKGNKTARAPFGITVIYENE